MTNLVVAFRNFANAPKKLLKDCNLSREFDGCSGEFSSVGMFSW